MVITDMVIIMCGYVEFFFNLLNMQDNILAKVGILRVLRLARIVRLMQLLRKSRSLKELQKLVTMLATCLKALLWSFLFCFVIMTVWAMLLVEIVHPLVMELNDATDVFQDCPQCLRATSSVMHANLLLFKTVIAGDSWGRIAVPVIEAHPLTAIIFMGSLLTLVFGVLNMIVAVVVDTFAEVRESDVMQLAEELDHNLKKDRKYLQKIFDRLDESGSGELTLENLLEGARRDPEFQSRLRVMDIDEVDLQQLFEMIDADGSGAIEAHEFIAPLSRWVRDSKTAPRFIKHNMLQSLDMQEELLKLQQYHFSQLSQRIDSLAAGTLAPAEAHFSDGMGTEGDVDDGNPILQTLPETEEDTIQQDVNEPGCELGIEQPAVSPYLSFAAERQPKPDPPAASPISTPHEREKNETPSDVTGDLFTVGDMDVHEPTGPGSGTARPRQVASKDPSRAPRKSIRSSEGSSALALFERLRNGMTGDEVQSALSRALEAFEVSFEIGMRKASERLLLQCMAKAEAALQEHLGPGRNYSSTSWSRLSSMEHVRAGRSQSRQSTQRVDGPPPPARRRSIRKSLGPSTATGSFWDLDS
ncbi:unnamed protein product [Effrenium voratum]|nr:unnamed protein product [Effrenium voratum]